MRTGIDIVEIKRIEKIKNLNLFLRKNFDETEINYINTKKNKLETIAGLFSAKEAVLKAFKIGLFKIPLNKVIISHDESGAPFVINNPEILNLLNEKNLNEVEINISHSENFAVSICIIN